jgi:glycosyltransferase involved in cell wall biosynthesis
VVVFFPGPLSPESGVETLIRALALASPSVRAVIAGEDAGHTAEGLAAFAESLGAGSRVEFPGRANGLGEYARTSIAGVVPSLADCASSEAALEIMSFGLPLLAASSGELIHMVQDGVTGLLHSPGNWRQLAGQIDHISRNRGLAAYLAENAMRYCRRRRLVADGAKSKIPEWNNFMPAGVQGVNAAWKGRS